METEDRGGEILKKKNEEEGRKGGGGHDKKTKAQIAHVHGGRRQSDGGGADALVSREAHWDLRRSAMQTAHGGHGK